LAAKICARSLVCRSPVVLARPENHRANSSDGAAARGDQSAGAGYDGSFPRRRGRQNGGADGMRGSGTPKTVLVTGVGDTVGQALVKAARQSVLPCRVLGTDRDEFSVGLQWADAGFVLPHCSRSDTYLAEMRRICVGEGAQLILPGSEIELELLSRN